MATKLTIVDDSPEAVGAPLQDHLNSPPSRNVRGWTADRQDYGDSGITATAHYFQYLQGSLAGAMREEPTPSPR